jgi:8-oxo-dGTP diphosphatase
MDKALEKKYGNRVRVRACGLCWHGPALLMVNHRGVTAGNFWAPPGGGVEFGSPASETIEREFLEETGLIVKAGPFRFGCEYINGAIHSVELFFETEVRGGKLTTGSDPEIQIIEAVRFMAPEHISALRDDELHGIFKKVKNIDELRTLRGFYRI